MIVTRDMEQELRVMGMASLSSRASTTRLRSGWSGGPGGAAPAGTEVVEGQIDHRQHAAEGDADEGAGGRQPVADVLRPEGQAHDHHGKAKPRKSLHNASMIWEIAVGIMFMCPWA